jgi:hypothetical protein
MSQCQARRRLPIGYALRLRLSNIALKIIIDKRAMSSITRLSELVPKTKGGAKKGDVHPLL